MDEIRKWLRAETPRKWVFYGDSITHGAKHTHGYRDYVELFAERVRFELARSLDIVITSAASGDTTRGLIAGFDWRVGQFRPDAVFVMIGMNDCSEGNDITRAEFRENLGRLTRMVRALGARPVLQTTCPILPGQAPDRRPHFDDFMDLVRAVAAEEDVPLVDHLVYWRDRPDSHFAWMNDAFHPNHHGHRAFARHLFEALGILDEASACCRLFLP